MNTHSQSRRWIWIAGGILIAIAIAVILAIAYSGGGSRGGGAY